MARTQGSARQEAERLVATVLAMATQGGGHRQGGGFGVLGDVVSGLLGQAGDDHRPGAGHPPGGDHQPGTDQAGRADGTPVGGAWATGSAECCICPVCRVIAGLRDPNPEAAERLATGAGDFATGVASLLRAFSAVTGDSTVAGNRASRPAGTAQRSDNVWVAAAGVPTGRAGDAGPDDGGTRGAGTDDAGAAGAGDAGAWAAATTAARGTGGAGSAATAERGTGGDAWAAATATTGDPTATVPRRKRPRAKPAPQSGPAAQDGTAQHGTAQHGTAQHGTAQHGTAQQGTAQQGTAQHGTAQHGTVTEPRTEAQSGPASWVRASTAGRGDDPWAAATASTGSRQDPDHDEMDHGAAGHDAGTGDEARRDGVV